MIANRSTRCHAARYFCITVSSAIERIDCVNLTTLAACPAIENRFGGNAATKKTQKNLLKQQYENFSASSTEKFLRSLSQEGHAILLCGEQPRLDNDLDDLFNNLKAYESEVKGHLLTINSHKSLSVPSSSTNQSITKQSNTCSDVNTVRHFSNFTKKVNTVKGTRVNIARPKAVLSVVKENKGNAVKASACWGNPQQDLKDKGVIDSGCSRHMTGNTSYLTDYEEIDGGLLPFGGIENLIDSERIMDKKTKSSQKEQKQARDWKEHEVAKADDVHLSKWIPKLRPKIQNPQNNR
ncbi:hypothetical protein Tco_1036511 [Tanacetum coccineum]